MDSVKHFFSLARVGNFPAGNKMHASSFARDSATNVKPGESSESDRSNTRRSQISPGPTVMPWLLWIVTAQAKASGNCVRSHATPDLRNATDVRVIGSTFLHGPSSGSPGNLWLNRVKYTIYFHTINFELGIDLGQCWHELSKELIETLQKSFSHELCTFSSTLFMFFPIKTSKTKMLGIA